MKRKRHTEKGLTLSLRDPFVAAGRAQRASATPEVERVATRIAIDCVYDEANPAAAEDAARSARQAGELNHRGRGSGRYRSIVKSKGLRWHQFRNRYIDG